MKTNKEFYKLPERLKPIETGAVFIVYVVSGVISGIVIIAIATAIYNYIYL